MSGQSLTYSPGQILLLKRHLATLGDICVHHSWGWGGTGMLWAKTELLLQLLQYRRAPKHPSGPSSAAPRLRKPSPQMQTNGMSGEGTWDKLPIKALAQGFSKNCQCELRGKNEGLCQKDDNENHNKEITCLVQIRLETLIWMALTVFSTLLLSG